MAFERVTVGRRFPAQGFGDILKSVLVDEFLPVFDVSDSVATVVDANAKTTWDALMQVDLIEVARRSPLPAYALILRRGLSSDAC